MGSRIRAVFQNIFLILVTSLVFCAVLELGSRIYLFHFLNEEKFLRFASTEQIAKRYGKNGMPLELYSRHRYVGYYPTPDYERGPNRHNSLGYRGEEIVLPKPKGEFRIVCLGGSTTYTTSTQDYRKSYPYLLEQELKKRGYSNVTVINAGAGSWTSWETLVNFEFRVLDLGPDMIIVYDAINDITSRFIWPPGAYRGDNSGRRAPNGNQDLRRNLWEHSTLIRILMTRAGRLRPQADLERGHDKSAPTYYGYEFLLQKRQGRYPEGIFKQVSAFEMLKTNQPVYFKRNLENLVTLAKLRGIKTVLSTFAYSPDFPTEPWVSSEEYQYGYREMGEVVKEVAREEGADLFDLASLFPKDKDYFTDGIHTTEKGTELMARLFADHIVQEQLIPQT